MLSLLPLVGSNIAGPDSMVKCTDFFLCQATIRNDFQQEKLNISGPFY